MKTSEVRLKAQVCELCQAHPGPTKGHLQAPAQPGAPGAQHKHLNDTRQSQLDPRRRSACNKTKSNTGNKKQIPLPYPTFVMIQFQIALHAFLS